LGYVYIVQLDRRAREVLFVSMCSLNKSQLRFEETFLLRNYFGESLSCNRFSSIFAVTVMRALCYPTLAALGWGTPNITLSPLSAGELDGATERAPNCPLAGERYENEAEKTCGPRALRAVPVSAILSCIRPADPKADSRLGASLPIRRVPVVHSSTLLPPQLHHFCALRSVPCGTYTERVQPGSVPRFLKFPRSGREVGNLRLAKSRFSNEFQR